MRTTGRREYRAEAGRGAKLSLADIDAAAAALDAEVAKTALPTWKEDAELWRLRKQYLERQAVGAAGAGSRCCRASG